MDFQNKEQNLSQTSSVESRASFDTSETLPKPEVFEPASQEPNPVNNDVDKKITESVPAQPPIVSIRQVVPKPPVREIDYTAGLRDFPVGNGDVIRREWIEGVERVVEGTKDNPHGRSDGINKVRRLYIEKRREVA